MAIGYKPFGAYREDAFLVSQMIGFVEDLPDEWKEKWLQMKEESEESYDDVDPGEQTPTCFRLDLSIRHDI